MIDEFLAREDRLAKYENHRIEIVVDRLVLRDGIERRLTDSLESALRQAMTDAPWRAKKADLARSAFEATYSAAAAFPLVERSWRTALDRRSQRVPTKYTPGSRTRTLPG